MIPVLQRDCAWNPLHPGLVAHPIGGSAEGMTTVMAFKSHTDLSCEGGDQGQTGNEGSATTIGLREPIVANSCLKG